MEIRNSRFFLTGMAILLLGVFVMVFDYPQIQYFEQIPSESYSLITFEEREIHQRLLIEFTVAGAISAAGAGLIIISFWNRQ